MKFVDLKNRIDEIPELATLPGTTAELLALLQPKDFKPGTVAALAETDPALTTKILRSLPQSNRAAKSEIVGVRDALACFGAKELRSLLFHYTVYSRLFRFTSEQLKLIPAYLVHSASCAAICRLLAGRFGIQTANREFTAGILHDIGKLCLIQYLPEQCVQIRQSIVESAMGDLDAENKFVGVTHVTIGGWLADRWRLPAFAGEVVKYHHDPAASKTYAELTALVNFAEACCSKIGRGFLEEETQDPLDHCKGWAVLEPLHPGLRKIHENEILSFIQSELTGEPEIREPVVADIAAPPPETDPTMSVEELKTSVHAIEELNSAPSLLPELLGYLDDPSVSLGKLSGAVKNDPELADCVLRIVNSQFYKFEGKVRTIQQAVAFMGLTEFIHLLVAILMISKLRSLKRQPPPDIDAYWDHAVGCGMIARSLSAELALPMRGREFIAGILHDLGKLLLAEYYPAASSLIDLRMKGEQCSDIQAEMAIIGVPHTEVGAWIGEKWNLPPAITEVVRFHHSPAQARTDPDLVALVHIADVILQTRNIGPPEGYPRIEPSSDEGWLALTKNHAPVRASDPVKIFSGTGFTVDDARSYVALVKKNPGAETED